MIQEENVNTPMLEEKRPMNPEKAAAQEQSVLSRRSFLTGAIATGLTASIPARAQDAIPQQPQAYLMQGTLRPLLSTNEAWRERFRQQLLERFEIIDIEIRRSRELSGEDRNGLLSLWNALKSYKQEYTQSTKPNLLKELEKYKTSLANSRNIGNREHIEQDGRYVREIETKLKSEGGVGTKYAGEFDPQFDNEIFGIDALVVAMVEGRKLRIATDALEKKMGAGTLNAKVILQHRRDIENLRMQTGLLNEYKERSRIYDLPNRLSKDSKVVFEKLYADGLKQIEADLRQAVGLFGDIMEMQRRP